MNKRVWQWTAISTAAASLRTPVKCSDCKSFPVPRHAMAASDWLNRETHSVVFHAFSSDWTAAQHSGSNVQLAASDWSTAASCFYNVKGAAGMTCFCRQTRKLAWFTMKITYLDMHTLNLLWTILYCMQTCNLFWLILWPVVFFLN